VTRSRSDWQRRGGDQRQGPGNPVAGDAQRDVLIARHPHTQRLRVGGRFAVIPHPLIEVLGTPSL
jgi:hypothetical protein